MSLARVGSFSTAHWRSGAAASLGRQPSSTALGHIPLAPERGCCLSGGWVSPSVRVNVTAASCGAARQASLWALGAAGTGFACLRWDGRLGALQHARPHGCPVTPQCQGLVWGTALRRSTGSPQPSLQDDPKFEEPIPPPPHQTAPSSVACVTTGFTCAFSFCDQTQLQTPDGLD